ncbi:hypothetical protein psyc5s11_09530 [Clostridium gelidum]|uniref:Histidine kinase/HSP90-like ATPase domain-containing protein n=1 Tax=Clostridium gelidum TaxID=704125 RepID=A0ABN6IRP1_9CLOT|nr:ATP-binding protein [Clostridium gelidum]BCZ44886.1 hypothetical protein psyc5s11_09530 [Clostridium gelidum]
MKDYKGKMVFYGTDNINNKMDNIIESFNLKNQHFEIKLIISEALNNAFIHGNKSDKNKPIYVEWRIDKSNLTLTVTDCGVGIEGLEINKEINNSNIFDENGRGLYIINCYTDEVSFKGNSIIMKKRIS